MLLELLKYRAVPKPRQIRIPNLDLIPEKMTERAEIREYDYDNGDQATWHASLPVRELYTHLPAECRWEPDYAMWRKLWAILGWFILFFSAYTSLFILLQSPLHPIFPALVLSLFGLFGGWLSGAKLCPTPAFWTLRRVWKDGTPTILPLTHTMLKGEPVVDPVSQSNNGNNGSESKSESDSKEEDGEAIHPKIKDMPSLNVAGFEAPPSGVYVPRIYRATTLFEDLQMRTERRRMRRPRDKFQAIALGAMALLTIGLVIGLIFVMAVTSNSASA